MPALTKDRHTALAEAIIELCSPVMENAKEGVRHAKARYHRIYFEAWEHAAEALFTALHVRARETDFLDGLVGEAICIQAEKRARAEQELFETQERLDAANKRIRDLQNRLDCLRLEMEPEFTFDHAAA